ncbi:MAG: L-lactate permease [Burkholderiaceae bacterium]
MTDLLAAAPLVAVMTILIVPGARVLAAMASGLLLVSAIALARSPFALSTEAWLDAILSGLSTTIPVAYVLLGGITLAGVMRAGGALRTISSALLEQLPDPLHRTLALVFGVAVFFESVTGFGVGAVVCAPIFVALGLAPWRAASLSLLGLNGVTWGALAIGTHLGATLAGIEADRLSTLAVLLSLPYWLVVGALALRIAGIGGRMLRRFVWLVVYVGLLGLLLVAVTRRLTFELAGAVAGPLLFAAATRLARLKRRDPATGVRPTRGDGKATTPDLRRSLIPFALLLAGLSLLRMPGPLARWASDAALFTLPSGGWQLAPIGHPGTWMLLAAMSALIALPEARRDLGLQARVIARSWSMAAIVVAGFLVFASIMTSAGMTAHLAARLTSLTGSHFVWLVAPIGALGGFLTGSNTGGNAMLMQIQLAAAKAIGLPSDWVAAAQNAAGANATLASPGRLILASHLTGCAGSEGRLLRLLGPVIVAGTLGTALILVIAQSASG